MNKKRVALTLAAALGVNTFVVSVGNFGGKVQVVHAQQQGRLTNTEDINKLNSIKIETLQTTVESVTDSEVILTFKDVNKDNVKNVSGSLAYTKFTERPTTDTNGNVNVFWDANTGKSTVKGMNAPGIYSGDVTIEYKDGTNKVYTLTLRKTYEENELTASINVGIGTIEVTDVKVNGQAKTIDASNTLELYLGDKLIDTIKTSNDNKFTVPDMKAGQVYKLVYKENGNEVTSTQIILTEQEQATVKAYATNTTTAANEIKTVIEKDYDTSTVYVTKTSSANGSTYLNDTNFNFKVGTTSVLDYTQTETKTADSNGAHRQGGAKIDVSSTSTTNANLTISVGGENVDLLYLDKATGGNFLPAYMMTWGPFRGYLTTADNGKQMNVAYGVGSVGLGSEVQSLYDASKEVSSVGVAIIVINRTKYKSLYVMGGVKPILEMNEIPPTASKPDTNSGATDANMVPVSTVTFNYDTSKLEHGYNSVSLNFTAEETPILGSTVAQLADMVDNELFADQSGALVDLPHIAPEKAGTNDSDTSKFNTRHTTTPVKASVVIAKDAIDGSIVNAKFERVSASEVNLILTNGKELLKGTDENTLARKLSVSGSTGISFVEKDNNGNLVFRVQFNGQVPSTINWKLNDLGSTINITRVDAVNFDGEVKVSNANTDKIEGQFDIVAKFNSTVPTGGTLGIDGSNSLRVTFSSLTNGSHKISTTTNTGKYQGTYSAGIVVSRTPFTIEVRDVKAVSSTSASIVIDANFFSTDDIPKVSGGVIQYSEKTINGNTTTWSDWKDSSAKVDKSEVKEEAITKTVDGLTTGKTYKFRAVYDYNNGTSTEKIYSNETTEVTLPTSSVNSTITGSGSTTGTSGGSTTINVTTINSTSYRASVSVNLPSGFSYDLGKNPVAVKITYRDLDGKIVTESKEQFSNVIAKFENGKVVLEGLVPGKDYSEISIDYIDNNGKTKTLVLKNIKVDFTTELEKYLANVYQVVFGRPADEVGYHFHLKNLMDKKVSLKEFLLNMLSEKEFIEKYKSAEEKIEALYSAIVSRSSDEVGKKFWIEEYKKLFEVYGSESTVLNAIADRMVNENELKKLADKMGVEW